MKLKFYFDEESRTAVCKFKLGLRYTGPPGHLHGGIIATILDEAMGKVNKLRNVVALTKNMNVEYLKPVNVQDEIVVEGRKTEQKGRNIFMTGEIRDTAGLVLARSRARFVIIE